MSSCDSVCASDYLLVQSATKGSFSSKSPSLLIYKISVVPRAFLLKVHLFISKNIYQEWLPNARLRANTWSLLPRVSQFRRKRHIFKNKLLQPYSKPHQRAGMQLCYLGGRGALSLGRRAGIA